MYYIEFIRKRPHVPWDEFHTVIRTAYKAWTELYPEDRPILAIARTWRLGPAGAAYVIVWQIDGFHRIDEWSEARRRDVRAAATIDEGTLSVADIDAGIYEEIGAECV